MSYYSPPQGGGCGTLAAVCDEKQKAGGCAGLGNQPGEFGDFKFSFNVP